MKENKLPLKNYNIFAPIRKMYNDNMEQYMAQGMSKDEAEKLARFHADAATAAVKAAMRADQKNDF
jgi:hypothetical protein